MKKASENNPFHPRHIESVKTTKRVGISREARFNGCKKEEIPQGRIDWGTEEDPLEIEIEISFVQLIGIFLILSVLYDLFSSIK